MAWVLVKQLLDEVGGEFIEMQAGDVNESAEMYPGYFRSWVIA